MKLSECNIGLVVRLKACGGISNGIIGHIVGLTYNIDVKHTGNMSGEELLSRTIPLVQFPDGARGIHPHNLEIYKD